MTRRAWAAAVALAAAPDARAHAFRPAFMELRELPSGEVDVTWKEPVAPAGRERARPRLPAACRSVTSPIAARAGDATVLAWTVDCGPEGLAGRTVAVEGLGGAAADALLRVRLRDGRRLMAVLRAGAPSFAVPASRGRATAAAGCLRLGVAHILGGFDHLAFVLGLLLLVRGGWRIVKTVTAFTAGHSVTLALATLGVVRFPARAVEAAIALSIVLVAVELEASRRRETLSARRPWALALAFGLLHGFGFAGALADLGLPDADIPLALALFNLGVEAGQLAFVAAAIGLRAAARAAARPAWLARAPAYSIGGLGVFWCLDRIAASW